MNFKIDLFPAKMLPTQASKLIQITDSPTNFTGMPGEREIRSFCSYKRFEYINLKTNKRTDLLKIYYDL